MKLARLRRRDREKPDPARSVDISDAHVSNGSRTVLEIGLRRFGNASLVPYKAAAA